MRSSKEVTVLFTEGEYAYRITQFNASEGIKIQARIVKLIGEPASAFGMAETNPQFLTIAAQKLCSNLEEESLVALVFRVLRKSNIGVVADGQQHDFEGADGVKFFNEHFAGEYKALVDLVREVLVFNYGPLAEWIGSLLKDSNEKSKESSKGELPSEQSNGKPE